jgi:hypothetical protein
MTEKEQALVVEWADSVTFSGEHGHQSVTAMLGRGDGGNPKEGD